MATMITLAQRKNYKGTFTQRKILWGVIEQLEGKEKSAKLDPIESLVIQYDNGKIESDTGSGLKFTTMTYAHLCTVMRDNQKIALHDAETFEPLYGIWQSEINTLFEEDCEDEEND